MPYWTQQRDDQLGVDGDGGAGIGPGGVLSDKRMEYQTFIEQQVDLPLSMRMIADQCLYQFQLSPRNSEQIEPAVLAMAEVNRRTLHRGKWRLDFDLLSAATRAPRRRICLNPAGRSSSQPGCASGFADSAHPAKCIERREHTHMTCLRASSDQVPTAQPIALCIIGQLFRSAFVLQEPRPQFEGARNMLK